MEKPMMNFKKAQLLPLVLKLGDYLKKGLDHYVQMKGTVSELDPDLLAAFLIMQMDSWNPKIAGRVVLDDDTKQACARFLGGVAYNLAK